MCVCVCMCVCVKSSCQGCPKNTDVHGLSFDCNVMGVVNVVMFSLVIICDATN